MYLGYVVNRPEDAYVGDVWLLTVCHCEVYGLCSHLVEYVERTDYHCVFTVFQFRNAEGYCSVCISACGRFEVTVQVVGCLFVIVNDDANVVTESVACSVDAFRVVEREEEEWSFVHFITVLEVFAVEPCSDYRTFATFII